jgi:hypothetical protein
MTLAESADPIFGSPQGSAVQPMYEDDLVPAGEGSELYDQRVVYGIAPDLDEMRRAKG